MSQSGHIQRDIVSALGRNEIHEFVHRGTTYTALAKVVGASCLYVCVAEDADGQLCQLDRYCFTGEKFYKVSLGPDTQLECRGPGLSVTMLMACVALGVADDADLNALLAQASRHEPLSPPVFAAFKQRAGRQVVELLRYARRLDVFGTRRAQAERAELIQMLHADMPHSSSYAEVAELELDAEANLVVVTGLVVGVLLKHYYGLALPPNAGSPDTA